MTPEERKTFLNEYRLAIDGAVREDGPPANLDSKHGHDIVVLLRDIAKKQGRTVIIVSHDHRIREVADRGAVAGGRSLRRRRPAREGS